MSIKKINNKATLVPAGRLGGIAAGVSPTDAVNKEQLDAIQAGTVDLARIEMSADGTAALPVITRDGDLNTGIYFIAADNIGVAAAGANVLDIGTTGLVVTGAVRATTTVTASSTTDATTKDTGAIITEGGIGVEKAVFVGGKITTSDTTASTTTTTGALVVAGGAGIAGALFVSTTTPASISATGVLTVTNATASTTKDTGAVIVEGGVGIEKEIFAGLSINAGTYLTSGNGTVSLPAIGPISDPNSGLYVIAADNLGMALGGAKVLDMRTTGLEVVGRVVKRPTATTVAANSGTTLTAAMMLSGYVEVTGTTGSLVLDSVANLTTALGTSPAGTTFEFTLNTMGGTPMTAGNTVTITAPASCTFMKQFNTTDAATAFVAVTTATAGVHLSTFRVVYNTATTIIVQRIG
jgi:hypothetical protein